MTNLNQDSRLSLLTEHEFSNCDSSVVRPLQQRTFIYKTVYAAALGRKVHLRAYVTFPTVQPLNTRSLAIAMFHGGAWADGFPITWFPASFYYASQGFTTVVFQYRIQRVHGSTPRDSIADSKTAYRWLVQNADFLKIDKNQIIAAGDSAGAHLALSLSMFPNITDEPNSLPIHPRAIIALYPVVDAGIKGLSGISPMDEVDGKNLPATLILQGEMDREPWTPPMRTEQFCQKANKLASAEICRLVLFPGPEYFHGFIGARMQFLNALEKIDAFLDREGIFPDRKKFPRLTLERMSENCQAPAGEALFKSWVGDFGYSTHTSSVW